MLDLLILLLFLGGLITGFRRGLIVQAIHMTGFIIALIIAYLYYKDLSEKFVLWIPYPGVTADSKLSFSVGELDLDITFYRLLAFVLIFIVVKFGLQLIASMFDFLKYLPVLGFLARLSGAVLGLVEFYIAIFLILYVAYLLPIDFIQAIIQKSIIASAMFEHTPLLSEKVKNWWYIYKN
ncbi:CvpA family protein [Sporosarcina pasteurii]|uniref:Colicin V production protein n=1 Tax=Sporosarcina pasteurii TaxID=1474 RepID=A0A380C5I1_SPOPA|nr:CvpA family protein [Sporosarcina pasteurii]MDS9471678.1 CvpA family protein [Sporosarcina pasteurii]QBQ04721.1 CvpA family protein [Sporosarcina pasteurii]SUJ11915.1 Colicin V production protein [Sporosarcina pasteurii]